MSENDLTIKILQGIREGAAPGGWWFATEVDIRLADDGFRPDIAGWRRERMPGLITDRPVTMRPDWICEPSRSTARGGT